MATTDRTLASTARVATIDRTTTETAGEETTRMATTGRTSASRTKVTTSDRSTSVAASQGTARTTSTGITVAGTSKMAPTRGTVADTASLATTRLATADTTEEGTTRVATLTGISASTASQSTAGTEGSTAGTIQVTTTDGPAGTTTRQITTRRTTRDRTTAATSGPYTTRMASTTGVLGVDECATATSPCPSDRICLDRPRGYTCACKPGFFDVRGTCRAAAIIRLKMALLKVRGLRVTYDDEYINPYSDQYKVVWATVENAVSLVLKQNFTVIYFGVHISFFYSGSLGVEMLLYFDPTSAPTKTEVENVLTKAVAEEQMESLTVVPDCIEAFADEDNPCTRPSGNDCSLDALCESMESSFTCQCKSGFDDSSADPDERPGRQCEEEDRSHFRIMAITLGLICGILSVALVVFAVVYCCIIRRHRRADRTKMPVHPIVESEGPFYHWIGSQGIDRMSGTESEATEDSDDKKISHLQKNMIYAPQQNGQTDKESRPISKARRSEQRRPSDGPGVGANLDYGDKGFFTPYIATGEEAERLNIKGRKSRHERDLEKEGSKQYSFSGSLPIPERDYPIPRAQIGGRNSRIY
ncbi:uncharacterized protein [Ptychodera flava]|uniref:uncharacterized protein n=1 Tax=Ptychodera flava TaxID=63121 RepID=UPI00396A14EA